MSYFRPLNTLLVGVVASLALTACAATHTTIAPSTPAPVASNTQQIVHVASFNIKFLGHYHRLYVEDLTSLLERYDLIFLQELVALPSGGPADGVHTAGDSEADSFFASMRRRGFSYAIAPMPTGQNADHSSATGAEWAVAFYRPSTVSPTDTLRGGYIDGRLAHNEIYDRVPYAFGFHIEDSDFAFVSVHLNQVAHDRAGRRRELSEIWRWESVPQPQGAEYIVLGDMNLQSCGERASDASVAADVTFLGQCQTTNIRHDKPFDQVMFRSASVGRFCNGVNVVDLIAEMRARWSADRGTYPGDYPTLSQFERTYSDHNPIAFDLCFPGSPAK